MELEPMILTGQLLAISVADVAKRGKAILLKGDYYY